jgi:polyisoprenoid-binding protein YceI
MKKIYFAAVFALITFSFSSCKKEGSAGDAQDAKGPSADAISYTVNTSTSVIEWTGSKQVGKHNGTLKLSGGTVFINSKNEIEGGNFVMDMNSIAVSDLKSGDGKEDLEGHLKGLTVENADHFFNVRKYPEASFEITNVSTEKGRSTIEGNLTIKETTKSVKFPAIVIVNDNSLSITSDTFIIDRTQWKVNYASKSIFTDVSDKFVNDEIEMQVKLKASR